MMIRGTICLITSLLLMATACGGGQEPSVEPQPEPLAVAAETDSPGVIDHVVESLSGETVDLASFRGKPILIVNTA